MGHGHWLHELEAAERGGQDPRACFLQHPCILLVILSLHKVTFQDQIKDIDTCSLSEYILNPILKPSRTGYNDDGQ